MREAAIPRPRFHADGLRAPTPLVTLARLMVPVAERGLDQVASIGPVVCGGQMLRQFGNGLRQTGCEAAPIVGGEAA